MKNDVKDESTRSKIPAGLQYNAEVVDYIFMSEINNIGV